MSDKNTRNMGGAATRLVAPPTTTRDLGDEEGEPEPAASQDPSQTVKEIALQKYRNRKKGW